MVFLFAYVIRLTDFLTLSRGVNQPGDTTLLTRHILTAIVLLYIRLLADFRPRRSILTHPAA